MKLSTLTMAAEQKHFLSFLNDCTDKQFKLLLKNVTKEQIIGLREVVLNILRGNIPLEEGSRRWLIKHKTFLRNFAYKGATRKNLLKHIKSIAIALTIAKEAISKL